MNIADLDNPTVVSAPTAPKMNIADLKDPTVVPASLLAKKDEPGALEQIGRGALESVKSVGRGVNTILQEASPYNKEGAHIPFSGLADDSKRREFERGISDVTTFGAAQKIGNAVSDALTPNLSVSDVAAGKKRQTLESTESADEAKAGNYREAGAVAGGAFPGVANVIPEVAKVVKAGAETLAPMAAARMTGRAIDDVAKGANRSFRLEIGKDTPTGKTLRNIMSEGPSRDLVKHAGDALAEENTITREIESRMKEKDAIVQRTMDRYISDGEAPMSVDGDKTVKVRNAPMSELVSDSRALPPIEREPGLIKRDGVPEVIENEPATTKAPRQSMRELTGASEPSNVIEMRRKGSLDPSEMKAKIVDKANELGRDDVGKQSSTMSIVGSLEKEIQAETKATGEDPDLFWWRKQQTKHQELSKPTSDKNIDHTTAQAAHAEVAELIGDAMVSHIDDPRYAQLNKEVSALIKFRNANASRIRNAGEAGKSPGVFGHRLGHYLQKTADAGSLIAAASGSPLALAVPLATHGLPFASRNIDRLLAKIAESKITGKPYADLASQALKLGASQSAIDNVIDKAHALQTGQRQ